MSNKEIEAIYPLSPSQQGILFETLSAQEPGIHIEQLIVTLHGDLNLAAFEQAWQRIVERHSLLRTGFVWKNQDEPLQFVQKQVKVSFKHQDWRGFSSSQQQDQLEAALGADRRSGFNLTKTPLMRLALFQISENTYHFLWTIHHILMDGWCLPLILKEVFAFYKALSTGQNLSLEPRRPYRDYIAWLKQQDLSEAEIFWRQKLQGFTKPTPLGITAEPSSFFDQQERYGKHKILLSTSATAALQSLVRQRHLTLNNLVQGIWALLLSRYCGEEEVVFGTTVSGRPPSLAGVESMVGLFINTLPMRIKVFPDALLWTWLKNIHSQRIEQQAYEYCSAGQVHQWSEVPGSLPLYESILVFENYPVDSSILQFSDNSIDVDNLVSRGAQTRYAITILVMPNSKLEFQIVYDNHRLDNLYITWILRHFLVLLESVVAVPDQQIATLLSQIPSDQIPKVRLLQKHNQQELDETFVAPRDALELQLAKIWENVLGVHRIGVRDNFFALGGHSLVAIRLIAQIQQQFGKNLPLATLFQSSTVEQLATILRKHSDSSFWSPLVAIQPNGSKRPFFCVPGGGGNVFYFYDLARHLDPDRPFYGLQTLGVDGESQPHTRIEDMASDCIQAIQTVQPQGPYLLGGHSFGGKVVFEIAQQLQKQGHEVALVAILDMTAPVPGIKQIGVDWDNARWLIEIAKIMENMYEKNLEISYDALQPLTPDEQLNYLLKRMKMVNQLSEVGITQMRGIVQVFKANSQVNYVPQEVYPSKITLFRTREAYEEFVHAMPPEILQDLAWGWGKFSAEPVDVHFISGNHLTMMSEPHVRVLAEQLEACIKQAQADD
ncbi:condensation domain-containing protein [Nostoc sp. CHAB 5784]|uniref:alpha/beta fold hydrolase n=1 Tax=Nostoc mirabile TaxID=2907820 RepID=UPI001E48BB5D|nr:alpha/beta fold hydrolase [Nostoc mirabile]MCC5669554.1 condensation domain-containing protein [Nostoc mirabile CHAB5784]